MVKKVITSMVNLLEKNPVHLMIAVMMNMSVVLNCGN